MPSVSHQSPGLAAVAVSLTVMTPGLAASSCLHSRVASMATCPDALAPALAPGALCPVQPRRCYKLLSALPPTTQPGHCRPPAWPLPTVLTTLTTTSTPTLSLSPSLSPAPSPSLSLSHTHTLSLSPSQALSLHLHLSLSISLSRSLHASCHRALSHALALTLARPISHAYIYIYI